MSRRRRISFSQITVWHSPAAVAAHFSHCLICAVLSDGGTALLLTPGTGICKPACGIQTARYRQRAAAVDEAAQTIPTVSPFNPAVREVAIYPLRFGRCQHRSTAFYALVCDNGQRRELASFRAPLPHRQSSRSKLCRSRISLAY